MYAWAAKVSVDLIIVGIFGLFVFPCRATNTRSIIILIFISCSTYAAIKNIFPARSLTADIRARARTSAIITSWWSYNRRVHIGVFGTWGATDKSIIISILSWIAFTTIKITSCSFVPSRRTSGASARTAYTRSFVTLITVTTMILCRSSRRSTSTCSITLNTWYAFSIPISGLVFASAACSTRHAAVGTAVAGIACACRNASATRVVRCTGSARTVTSSCLVFASAACSTSHAAVSTAVAGIACACRKVFATRVIRCTDTARTVTSSCLVCASAACSTRHAAVACRTSWGFHTTNYTVNYQEEDLLQNSIMCVYHCNLLFKCLCAIRIYFAAMLNSWI